ncbi:MAG: hypothetical protein D6770_03055 [Anaerolineae bacterium]|nr:MAG: hypothetical protein D6770_03055 [Anaerolineae bacterium]
MCGGPIRGLLRTVQQVSLPQETMPRAPAPIREAAAPAPLTCPTCKTPVQASFSWCPTCGSALKPQPCAYCGHILSPEETTCPACGAPRPRAGAVWR